jgi:site-specific DNA-methyltransferase (adenine-specific)
MNELRKYMDYHWTLAYLTPGGQSPSLVQKSANTFWKPVLWFVKGKYEGDYIGDVIKSPVNDNDKRFHEWGQSLGGFREIIEKFTYPGQLILDPFLGGGTTGVCAVTMGRSFIGTDVERNNIEITRSRIVELIEGQSGEGRTDELA